MTTARRRTNLRPEAHWCRGSGSPRQRDKDNRGRSETHRWMYIQTTGLPSPLDSSISRALSPKLLEKFFYASQHKKVPVSFSSTGKKAQRFANVTFT